MELTQHVGWPVSHRFWETRGKSNKEDNCRIKAAVFVCFLKHCSRKLPKIAPPIIMFFFNSPSGKSEQWQRQRLRRQGRWGARLQGRRWARLRRRPSSRLRLPRAEKQAHARSRPWAPCPHLAPSSQWSRRLPYSPSPRPSHGAQSRRCPHWLGHRQRPGEEAARKLRARSQPSRGWHVSWRLGLLICLWFGCSFSSKLVKNTEHWENLKFETLCHR